MVKDAGLSPFEEAAQLLPERRAVHEIVHPQLPRLAQLLLSSTHHAQVQVRPPIGDGLNLLGIVITPVTPRHI